MAFYYSVGSSPAARQVVLILDPPRSPRRMFLFELDYPLFKIFWNGVGSIGWSWSLWLEIINSTLFVCADPPPECSNWDTIYCIDLFCLSGAIDVK